MLKQSFSGVRFYLNSKSVAKELRTVKPLHKPEKILLLPICGLGDAVCYIPFVRSLRKEFPGSEIVAIVATDSAKAIIVGNSPDIEVIVFNRCQQPGWMSPLRLLRKLRRRRFDLVISGAHLNSIRVPLLAYLCCRKTRVGAKSERLSFLYNRTVNVPTNAHAFERFRQLLTAVGIHMSFQEYSPTIEPSSESRDSAMQLWKSAGLDNSECIVGMASGADLNNRGRWLPSLKRWPVERYAEVAKYAAITCQARIVVFGTSEEAPLASAIAESSGVPIVNLCGKTRLPELQWLLRQCNAFVSNDTGTMHLATALGTPVVALFGPTSRESFGPLTTQSRTIQGEAPCSPCYPYPTCTLKGCLAMEDISSHEVIAALSSILTTQKSATLFPIESLGLVP
jgi:lipopolysaccharide heptosyltransferase II